MLVTFIGWQWALVRKVFMYHFYAGITDTTRDLVLVTKLTLKIQHTGYINLLVS